MSQITLDELLKRSRDIKTVDISPAVEGLRRGLAREKRLTRIDRCRKFSEFCSTYLSHHFYDPYGEHHEDLFRVIEDPVLGKRIVRGEPREHGKSTIMVIAAPLYWMAYRLKYYILLFGSTHSAIFPHYSTLQSEIDLTTGNQLLLEDFPHLRPEVDFKGQYTFWSDYKMRLESGATVECRGIMSKFRGLKMKQYRPDVIVCDDVQDEEDIYTDAKRRKLSNRFKRTILNLGSRACDIFLEGNLMHRESLLAEYLRNDRWDRKLYRALNIPSPPTETFPIGNSKEDGEPLWPERWSVDRLTERKAIIGSRAFNIEFLNMDRGDEELLYDSSKFSRFDQQKLNLENYYLILYWDPASGKEQAKGKQDYTGMSVVACRIVTHSGNQKFYWVLDVYLGKASPEQQIDIAIDFVDRYPVRKVIYEDNGGFSVMVPFLKKRARERGVSIPLKTLPQSKNKVQRIMSVEPIIKNQTFFDNRINGQYFVQWDEFPNGAHEDGPDSTVGAIEFYESLKVPYGF